MKLEQYKVVKKYDKNEKISYYILKDDVGKKYFAKVLNFYDKDLFNQLNNELDKYNKLKQFDFLPKVVEYNRNYVIFEYIEGKSIDNTDNLNLKEIITLFIEICKAVKKIHDCGLVHCDIKTKNIIITNKVNIIDYGICSNVGDIINYGSARSSSIEQLLGKPVTVDFDLYSLGILLYKMLTGEIPYKISNKNDLIKQKQESKLSLVGMKYYMEDLDIVINKMISKKYKKVDSIISDLNLVLKKLK